LIGQGSEEAVRYRVICVDAEPEALAALRQQLDQICGPEIEVEACPDAEEALALVEELDASRVRVPLIVAEQALPGISGVDLLLALHEKPGYRATRKALVSARVGAADLTRALNRGALQRSIAKPWDRATLRDGVRSLLTAYLIESAPEALDRFSGLVDLEQLPRAHGADRPGRRALDLQLRTLKRSFFANAELSDEQVHAAMGAAVDEALNDPPAGATPPARSCCARNSRWMRSLFWSRDRCSCRAGSRIARSFCIRRQRGGSSACSRWRTDSAPSTPAARSATSPSCS
jgi:CheY-like chemotaxis protein